MSIAQSIKDEFDSFHKLALETPEDAHTHVLWDHRMERAQKHFEEHVSDEQLVNEARAHIHALRKLMARAMETKVKQ